MELADPQTKKAVWWGVAEKILTGNSNKDFRMVEGTISKMFREYPPPGKKVDRWRTAAYLDRIGPAFTRV